MKTNIENLADTARRMACRALCRVRDVYRQVSGGALVAVGFLFICVLTGISMAFAFDWSIWVGLVFGLVLGGLPAGAPRFDTRLNAMRCIELVSLAYLAAISVLLSVQTLLPLLNGLSVKVLASAPLLLMTAVLYIIYIMVSRHIAGRQPAHTLEIVVEVFSTPPMLLILAMSVVLATYTLLVLEYIGLNYEVWQTITVRFLERGIIPPVTLILFFWGLLLLANKWWVLSRERRLLNAPDGAIQSSLMSAWQAFCRHGTADLDAFLEIIWKKSVDFYTIPRYINWAIPILGFIGTVLGISLAADGIQRIINTQSGVSQLSSELGQAIAPLGIAFDTTLIALSLSVFLTLLQTALQRWEDNFLINYESRMRAGGGPRH